jgi:hypothetical protein
LKTYPKIAEYAMVQRVKRVRRQKPVEREQIDVAEMRASLTAYGWINETLRLAAESLGELGTPETVLTLLILRKSRAAMTAKRLIRLYRAWSATPRSVEVERNLGIAVARLLQSRLIEVGAVDDVAISKHKGGNVQIALGKLLELGLASLQEIRPTKSGLASTKQIRRTIDERLREARKRLQGEDRDVFDEIIAKVLPDPPEPDPED